MKNIVTLVVFAIIIAFSAGSVVAESNPLLTVFEALEIGMKVGEVQAALIGYEDGSKCYCAFNNTKDPKTIKAEWQDPQYEYTPKGEYNRKNMPWGPRAELEVEMNGHYNDGDAKIVKATYRYKFLKLEKELIKK